MRWVLLGLALVALGGCEFIGGGETVVRGSDNLIVSDGSSEVVARALSELDTTPPVTDEELREIYVTIRDAAREGNLEAVQVVLRLAAIQRAPKEDETEN
jgi:hypothetical protein